MIENLAIFTADYLDNSEEDVNGEIAVPAGRNIAEAIANQISSSQTPSQYSFYGWKFEFKCPSGRSAWVLLQCPNPWLLIVEAKTSWLERESKKEAAFDEAKSVVQTAMESIAGLKGIKWVTQEGLATMQRQRG